MGSSVPQKPWDFGLYGCIYFHRDKESKFPFLKQHQSYMKSNENIFSNTVFLPDAGLTFTAKDILCIRYIACGYLEMESMPSIWIIYGNTFKMKVILAEAKTTIRFSYLKGTCSWNTARTCYTNIYLMDLHCC